MNNIVVVGSSINPRPGTFTYSPTRSKFDADERFRQTIFTINSLQNSLPNTKIVIIDDNSNKDLVKSINEYSNIEVVESEYPGRGELLHY